MLGNEAPARVVGALEKLVELQVDIDVGIVEEALHNGVSEVAGLAMKLEEEQCEQHYITFFLAPDRLNNESEFHLFLTKLHKSRGRQFT